MRQRQKVCSKGEALESYDTWMSEPGGLDSPQSHPGQGLDQDAAPQSVPVPPLRSAGVQDTYSSQASVLPGPRPLPLLLETGRDQVVFPLTAGPQRRPEYQGYTRVEVAVDLIVGVGTADAAVCYKVTAEVENSRVVGPGVDPE